ncbi:MAG TPA: DinB family protein [Bryobacteraceae bacterium]|jgi:uncharacterized damage-inducible protein DinB
MIPLPVLRELYDYNYWARDRQFAACRALTSEQFVQPVAGFGSVRDTLLHLVGVEWVWLERWLGRSPESLPWRDEAATLDGLEARARSVEAGMRDYLARLTEEEMLRPFSYRNFKGERWTYKYWEALLHVVNHQTYHRGQVTTLLRQLGAQPAAIDYLLAVEEWRPVRPE